MKQERQNLFRFLAGAILFATPLCARGQGVVPPEAIAQFQQVIGNRVEASTILGGDQAAAGGIYTFRGGRVAELGVTKIGGAGEVASPMPLAGKLQWAPILIANVGHMKAENNFESGYLAGNGMNFDTFALQAGGGARIYFTDQFSCASTLSGIYGHTKDEFIARNSVGDAVESAASGTFVNWTADTWSVVPGVDLRYQWMWGRSIFTLTSRYTFYHTESFDSTSEFVNVDGISQAWENRLDVDVPLGWKLFGQELRAGGFFNHVEMYGGLEEGLNSSYLDTANARLVADLLGKVWKCRWVGIGVSYFWGDNFGGWSAGLDLQFQF
jgi:hypothetical protein